MLLSEYVTRKSLRNIGLARKSPSVTIDKAALAVYAEELKRGKKTASNWKFPGVHPEDNIAFAGMSLVGSAVNFHLPLADNPREKFTVPNPSGKAFTGSFGMERCFYRTFGETRVTTRHLWPFFGTLQATKDFFRGSNQIPLIEHRHWILQEVLTVLDEKFSGNPMYMYEEANWNAPELIQILTDSFPQAFGDDVSTLPVFSYGGDIFAKMRHELVFPFYKKAKLVCLLYHGRALDHDTENGALKPLTGMHNLTAVEDYQVPRALQNEGVLVYSDALLEKIKNYEIIRRHGVEELEIRASTTEANAQILEILNDGLEPEDPKYWTINELDGAEWFGSRGCPLPHHITPSTAY